MKRLAAPIFLLLLLLSSSSLEAQTLDRVYARARELWAFRSSGNKIEAEKYVEPASQKEFLSLKEPIKAEVTAIELSEIPTVVNVVSKVQMFAPELGQNLDRIVRESWEWNGTDWFLHIEPSSPFPFDTHAIPGSSKELPAKNVQVEFLQHEIDLGKHVQGEIISGRLEFRGDQKEIVTVRPADLQGLSFDPITWQTPGRGVLKFTLDTALMPESFQKILRFDFLDSTGGLHTATVGIRANIEGRVRFTQIPRVIDTHSDGICVLQIQNLSGKPTRLLTATIGNDDFKLDSSPDTIPPRQTRTIQISHSATQASGAALNLTFSEDLLGKRNVIVPLQFAVAPTTQPAYTREELDAIRRKALP